MSSAILRLADMLAEQKVTCVVMEATGDYWKPFYSLLAESGLPVMLVNASQVRRIAGPQDRRRGRGLAGRPGGARAGPWLVRARSGGKELKDLVRARTILVRLAVRRSSGWRSCWSRRR